MYLLPIELVRSKVYPLERRVGSSKCGSKKFRVFLNISELDLLESFQTKRHYKVNHYISCNDKYLICLLSCKICGLHYVGSNTDRFRLRWNNYEDNDREVQRGEEHMQRFRIICPFHSEEYIGFLHDCSTTLIDTDSSDCARRGEFWRTLLKTLVPYGVNKKE